MIDDAHFSYPGFDRCTTFTAYDKVPRPFASSSFSPTQHTQRISMTAGR